MSTNFFFWTTDRVSSKFDIGVKDRSECNVCTYQIKIDPTLYTTELGPHINDLNIWLTAQNTDITLSTYVTQT